MSFKEQERAMFDLLFDRDVRESFCVGGSAALVGYQLDDNERKDFDVIRPDALTLDAVMRGNLILSQLCRTFPMSFGLISSFEGGFDGLKMLVDVETMSVSPVDRPVCFGQRLKQLLTHTTFESDTEHSLILTVLDAELGMAWTAASLKNKMSDIDGVTNHEEDINKCSASSADKGLIDEDWQTLPVKLASYVSAVMLPQSLHDLKKQLCEQEGSSLWRHLSKSPLHFGVREKILAQQNLRFLVSRAYVKEFHPCEPVVEHLTVELADGFAQLFQYVDGVNTIAGLLLELKKAGAPEDIVDGVKGGFLQLLEAGMIEVSG